MNFLNNEFFVGHYTSLEIALEILTSNRLLIGEIGKVNDPYENKVDWLESIGMGNEPMPEAFNLTEKVRTLVEQHIKVFSTSFFKDTKHLDNLYYANMAMWAHYGNNHKGVCLIFDREKLTAAFNRNLSKIGEIIAKKVSYCSWSIIIQSGCEPVNHHELNELSTNLKKLHEHINSNSFIEDRLFRKMECWNYENEYRWLFFSKEKKNSFLDYENSLQAVVLGSAVSPNLIQIFKAINIGNIYKLNFNSGKIDINKV